MKTAILIRHDGHKFFTSENQINSENEVIGFSILFNGRVCQILRRSIYGEILIENYKNKNFELIE